MGLIDRFLRRIRLFTDKMKYAPKRWRKAKLGGFYKLLFRWKGSVYKLLWREALVFSFLYAMVSSIYHYVLDSKQKEAFEDFCIYAEEFTSMMPISFVLGFYVSIIVQRWWDQFLSIPWPDKLAYDIAANVYGDDEGGRLLRRTMIRYINLGALLTFCTVSKSVKKRFPTIDYVVDAGFMTEHERRVYEDIPSPHPKHWLPCAWFINLVRKAVDEDRIKSAPAAKTIVDDLNQFHDHCDDLYGYDWVTIPLVYTQVVTIAVYTFFGACLFGRQYLDLKGRDDLASTADIQRYNVDYYIPAFTMLQFLFYFGWLKVAENLMNPFGEDDDDFEMNWVVDRNLQVSYLIVDHVFKMKIPLEKDKHYDTLTPELPYTKISFKTKTDPWMGSAYRVRMSESDKAIVSNTKKKKDKGEESEKNYLRRRNNALERSEDEDDDEMGGGDIYERKEASSPILQRHHSNEHLEDAIATKNPRRTSNTSGTPSKVIADFDVVEGDEDLRGCRITVTNL